MKIIDWSSQLLLLPKAHREMSIVDVFSELLKQGNYVSMRCRSTSLNAIVDALPILQPEIRFVHKASEQEHSLQVLRNRSYTAFWFDEIPTFLQNGSTENDVHKDRYTPLN